MMGELLLLKHSNDVIASGEGITYAVLLTEPERNTAAGAAVAYRVEIMPAFDEGMDKTSLVTLLQDVLGFLFRYFTMLMWSFFHEYFPSESDQYLRIYWIITVSKYSPACAWPQSYSFSAVHHLLGLTEVEQVGSFPLFTIEISYCSNQPTYQWYPGPLGLEDVVPEKPLTVSAV